MEYVYYHFKTGSIAEAWDTAEIEAFLRSTGLFPADRFVSQRPFLSIGLMHVEDFDSWDGQEYDPARTNYIAVVTSDNWYWGVRRDARIQAVVDGPEQLLHTTIAEDW